MEFNEMLTTIAQLFGRKSWADFSIWELNTLRDIYDRIDEDAYVRGYMEDDEDDEEEDDEE